MGKAVKSLAMIAVAVFAPYAAGALGLSGFAATAFSFVLQAAASAILSPKAGGGGTGCGESGGAGGHSERVIDVQNVSSVSVSVGNPGGGTNYAGCGGNGNGTSFGGYCSASGGYGANCRQQHAGGIGGNGSGGNINTYGGGGNGGGWWSIYGQHQAGASYFGGTQPSSHQQSNYAHRHQSHCAWGAGGQGSMFGNRGARGREGVVVVYEYYG